MQYTDNLKLRKPNLDDQYDVGDFNHNSELIDNVVSEIKKSKAEIDDNSTGKDKTLSAQKIISNLSTKLADYMPNKLVSNTYDIETIGTYIQLQNENSYSNSLGTYMSANTYKGLYMLFSTQTGPSSCTQYAIDFDGRTYTRFYMWWAKSWSTWTTQIIKSDINCPVIYTQPSSSTNGQKVLTITKSKTSNLVRVYGRRGNGNVIRLCFDLLWDTWSTEPTWVYSYTSEGSLLPTFTYIDGNKFNLDFSNCSTGAIGVIVEGASQVTLS